MRAAGLGHEALDHAMEDNAVIKAFADQFLDMGDVAGREIGAHADDHLALGGFQRQEIAFVGHGVSFIRR